MPVNSFENYPMSWRPKLKRGKKALYLTIAKQLEDDIKAGIVLPGTKLPPQRELADFLDVNVSTISKAFKQCELKGLLTATIGSGTFVSYDATTNSYIMPRNNDFELIEMASILPDLNSSQEIVEKLKEISLEPDVGNLFTYGKLDGALWQREAAVEIIKGAGYETTENKILFSNGGQNALTAILSGVFKSGDKIGVDPLTYPGMKTTAKMIGIQLVPISQQNGEMSKEGILYACQQECIKGLYIIPDYQNPTTHIMSDECRKMIAEVAVEKDLIVIEDSIYSFLLENPKKAVASYAPDNVIYIYSLSKTVAPGLRLGYMVSPLKYKKDLFNALYNMNITVSPFMLEIASRMIVSKSIYKLMDRHRASTRERNALVEKYLGEYSLIGDENCIFKWFILPEKFDALEFENLAYKKGVRIYSANKFIVGKEKPANAVRLAVTSTSSIEELEKGLIILKQLLESESIYNIY